MIIESLLESLRNPGSPTLGDVVIHDTNDELVLVEADPDHRLGVTEFIRGQSFYDRAHCHDALKEFSILNNFELQHIKTDSAIVTTRCRTKSCMWHVHAGANRSI